MKNIFAKFQDYVKKPNRNAFDLSFYNNLTLKFGQLTPVFCKEVIPGDSFRINTAFGLQLMPMKFPVQTPMRAYIHYFYVRNRTLWKDWMDFIGGTKDGLTPPYVTPIDKEAFYRVGGIADYFGIPNVVYKSESGSVIANFPVIGRNNSVVVKDDEDVTLCTYNITLATSQWVAYEFLHYVTPSQYAYWRDSSVDQSSANNQLTEFCANAASYLVGTTAFSAFNFINPANQPPQPWTAYSVYFDDEETDLTKQCCNYWSYLGRFDSASVVSNYAKVEFTITNDTDTYNKVFPVVTVKRNANNVISVITGQRLACEVVSSSPNGNKYDLCLRINIPVANTSEYPISEFYTIFPIINTISNANKTNTQKSLLTPGTNVSLVVGREVSDFFDIIGSDNLPTTPYDNDIHLNALPFRAYEAIYNAYYRNPQNNPFILNGTPEYNRYNTTYDGGADSTDYHLYFRNWEYDFLTSSVQSPQQGTAPLVGISVTGEATFQDEDGNTYYAQAILNDQGEITGWQSHSSNMPTGSLRLLMDMAGSGISINDLRNVNAFQRFLENNIRRGLKYRDQLMSHFGVKARYDELDMPEFIGGCSTSVNVNKLSQTSESDTTPLGSFVGQASAFGQSKHSITHYCDEHGFIIGIMSIVPVPVYSQLLPKFFTKSQQLDYYFPEFGHIGYQPILQKEVSPLQTYYSSSDLNKVFGYNRAWYDYLASTDEVHGQFRTTMRDFLMNRTFESEPELSEEFLLVDPNQLNDVFLTGTDDNDLYAPESDKIIGSIYFDVSAKRPIPLFGIPKLTE